MIGYNARPDVAVPTARLKCRRLIRKVLDPIEALTVRVGYGSIAGSVARWERVRVCAISRHSRQRETSDRRHSAIFAALCGYRWNPAQACTGRRYLRSKQPHY